VTERQLRSRLLERGRRAMKKRRNRLKQSQSLEQRLTAHAAQLLEDAKTLPPGTARDALLRRAEQAETAAMGMSQWLSPQSN
jgi:mannitol/fructose-specific phosphotransferase system IIA component (Ntr-type)